MRSAARLAAAAVLLPLLALPAVPGTSWASTTTVSKVVERVHLVDGQDVVADRRTVKVTIGDTTNLRDRQSVRITWSGAHPSNLSFNDPNTEQASQAEWPVVVLECRGVDSSAVPLGQQVRPETCWTQTPAERYFESDAAFPPWRVDRYATSADRAANVGQPQPLPKACRPSLYQQHWLHFVSVAGTDYSGGAGGCAGMAPESALVDSKQSMPPNTTYASTDAQGNGSTKFVVWTSQTNASLGCSDTVACSLVVIPVEGVSCDVDALSLPPDQRPTGDDADAARDLCQAKGGGAFLAPAVSGKLWWSASNWRNRITVPLSFTRLPADCGLSSSTAAVVYGSELLAQATQSWATKLCGDPTLPPLRHVQVGEPQARNLLSAGSVSAAFVSDPPNDTSPPHVLAPTALTGFAISYVVDDAHGQEYSSLKLTPRLLAKLLTMSYPAVVAEKNENPGLVNNPMNVSLDPEFQLLNPGVKHGVDAGESAAFLYSLSSDSDVVEALTAYIGADPEARAWLDGKPDPWGMTVNPAYKGIQLPVHGWPLLDDVLPPSIYTDTNKCLQANPVPFLPLIAAPTSRLATISLAVQFALSPSQIICQLPPNQDVNGAKLLSVGRQPVGSRFLIGVTTLADATRYDLDTAALQTQVSSSASADLSSLAGRSFVAPSTASLQAAGALLKPDDQARTWRLNPSDLAGPAADARAYPGAMLVSTEVPTSGLDSVVARRYAALLRFVAGPGQQQGAVLGTLPAGYLPLTSADGLGALSSYTLRAADAVAAQAGTSPMLVAAPATPAPTAPAPSPAPAPADLAAPTPASPAAALRPDVVPTLRATPGPTPVVVPVAAVASTASALPGLLGGAVPGLLSVALAAGLVWLGLTVQSRRGGA